MKRSWPWTISWLVAAVISAGLAWVAGGWAMAPSGSWFGWVIVVVTAIFALAAVFLGIFAAGSIPCSHCGKPITGFETTRKEAQLGVCPDCNVYMELREGVIRTIDDDEISLRHPFRVSVDGNVQWPPICLACNAPADRETETSWDLSKTGSNVAASAAGLALFAVAGAGFVSYGGGTRITLRVPSCAQHEGGARVLSASGGRATIGFRSRRAHKAFLDLNRHATIEPSVRGIVEEESS